MPTPAGLASVSHFDPAAGASEMVAEEGSTGAGSGGIGGNARLIAHPLERRLRHQSKAANGPNRSADSASRMASMVVSVLTSSPSQNNTNGWSSTGKPARGNA